MCLAILCSKRPIAVITLLEKKDVQSKFGFPDFWLIDHYAEYLDIHVIICN